MSVVHGTTVVVPDDPAFPVGSDEWNAAHTGTIDDTMHGSRGSALHADSHTEVHAIDGTDHTGSLTHAALATVTADQHHTQLHAAAHTTGADKIATGTPDGTQFLRDDFAWTVPPVAGLIEGFYDPGSTVVETEHFVIHRDHMKLTSTERLTLEGTARLYERDLGENNYGPQGELADPGFVVVGTPKAPTYSFLVPTDYQYQLLNRLQLRGTMRGSLVGTADVYIENDAPSGGRIAITGRGVNASG